MKADRSSLARVDRWHHRGPGRDFYLSGVYLWWPLWKNSFLTPLSIICIHPMEMKGYMKSGFDKLMKSNRRLDVRKFSWINTVAKTPVKIPKFPRNLLASPTPSPPRGWIRRMKRKPIDSSSSSSTQRVLTNPQCWSRRFELDLPVIFSIYFAHFGSSSPLNGIRNSSAKQPGRIRDHDKSMWSPLSDRIQHGIVSRTRFERMSLCKKSIALTKPGSP